MSRNHSYVAHEVAHIVKSVNAVTSPEELESLYGITIRPDGKVLDNTYDMLFDTVADWARFSVELDDAETEEHFSQHQQEY